MKRSAWTDQRIGERMDAIDSTFDMLRHEIQGLREDDAEQFAALRGGVVGEPLRARLCPTAAR